MTRHSLRSALLFSCALLAFPNSALANQDTDQDEEASGDGRITVTGDVLYSNQVNSVKTPTPIIDVPQSLTITTQEQIQEQGFDSIGDIVLYTPGVTNSQGEGHRDAVVFRGVRSTADFFVDGVRDDLQYYRGLYNLEQVEILRGPNALLFGRGSTGGALNRVTKKGVIGDQFVGFLVSVDTFGAFTGQIDLNFATSESSALRINAAYENLNNHRDFYDGERIGINPTFRAELGPDTIIDLSYEFADHSRFVDRGIPSNDAGDPAEQFVDITFADRENNFLEFEAHVFRGTIQHAFSDQFKGNFTVSYGDYDKVYANLFPVGFNEETGLVRLDGYIDTTQRQNLVLAGNLIGEFETGSILHTLLFGAEFIDTVNNNDRFNPVFATSAADIAANEAAAAAGNPLPFPNALGRTDQADFLPARPITINNFTGTSAFIDASGAVQTRPESFAFSALNDDTEADVRVFSLYIQDEIELTDWLNVVIGGRYDRFEIEVLNVANGDFRTRTDEEFSPRAGLILKPQENISIYASYSESFLPRSGEQFANINGNNDVLEPNTFTNLEAGIKWDINEQFGFTAAVFEIEQSSPVVSDLDAGLFDIIDTRVQGFEAQLQGQVAPWWFVSAGYSFIDGEQANSTLRPRELPENQFSIWNQFTPTDRLGLGVGLTAQDESFADNGNTVTLPSYARVDVAAFYDVSDNLRLQVNVENLFDTQYFPNSHTADNITVGAPLNARFTITGRF
ncbi:MAG: TonB-dependent receptor [Pseudomonadota bacterium]